MTHFGGGRSGGARPFLDVGEEPKFPFSVALFLNSIFCQIMARKASVVGPLRL